MKILITGAGGMLGTDLAARLCTEHELLGVGRKPAPHLKISFRTADLSRSFVADEIIQSFRPRVILHAAALTDVDGCELNRMEALRGNFQTTRVVADAANQAACLVIFFSTDFVFDGRKEGAYEETDTPFPVNVYGETKLLAERYLLLRGRHFLILRTSWTFGCHGNSFPRKVLKQAEEGNSFPVISDQVGKPTYTADLAEALAKLLPLITGKTARGLNQIYHVANEGAVSRCEFALEVLKKRGLPTELVTPIPYDAAPPRPAARPRNSTLSTDKLKRQFGISLRPWGEALDVFLQEESKLTV